LLHSVLLLVPRDVLDGPHGAKVLRAAEDEAEIIEGIGKLSKTDRDMIPDVRPTVESLVERVAALAQALQRLITMSRPTRWRGSTPESSRRRRSRSRAIVRRSSRCCGASGQRWTICSGAVIRSCPSSRVHR
jgi:hypothetical protein